MYTQPYDKLMSAKTNENKADHLVRGSSAASWIWNIVRIVLCIRVSHIDSGLRRRVTDVQSRAETRLNVFHSRMSVSTKLSQESLNRANAGDTVGGFHSSG